MLILFCVFGNRHQVPEPDVQMNFIADLIYFSDDQTAIESFPELFDDVQEKDQPDQYDIDNIISQLRHIGHVAEQKHKINPEVAIDAEAINLRHLRIVVRQSVVVIDTENKPKAGMQNNNNSKRATVLDHIRRLIIINIQRQCNDLIQLKNKMHHVGGPRKCVLPLEIEIEEEHPDGDQAAHKKPDLYRAQEYKDYMRRFPTLCILIFPAQKSRP
jgi:hypothetical protein